MFDIRCRCGEVHLKVRGPVLRHFICHCRDCRRSMAWIEEQGGTCARHPSGGDQSLWVHSDGVEVVAGAEHIATYSVSEPVRTARVQARCCHTALASTFTWSAKVCALKTVGVQDPVALPPVDEHIHTASAEGPLPDDGLPRRSGLGGPFLWTVARSLAPFDGHRGHRWAPLGDVERV